MSINRCGNGLYPFNYTKHNGMANINLLKPTGHVMHQQFNPLKTKRRLLYLKTQYVPRSKHFSFRL